MLGTLVQKPWKILLIVLSFLLSGCAGGTIKIYNLEKEHGLVRRKDKGSIREVITFDKADRKYGCMKWDDIRTSVEFIQASEDIGD